MSFLRRYNLVFTRCSLALSSGIIVSSAAYWPLEETLHFTGEPLVFALKCGIIFLALLLPLFGLGQGILTLIDAGLDLTTFPRRKIGSVTDALVDAFAALLVGLVLTGLIMFLCGQWSPPTRITALISLLPGYLCAVALPNGLPPFTRNSQVWRAALDQLRGLSRGERGVLAIFALVYGLRAICVFDFQGHEDAYIYHLALAESWIRTGTTGILPINIYSGYALAVEHFYLVLKLLLGGNAEQTILAQMAHLFIGFNLFLAAFLAIIRPLLPRVVRVLFLVALLQPHFMYFAGLPKNDAFLAGACALALLGLIAENATWFLAAAACAFIVKPTAAITFFALGLAYFAKGVKARSTTQRARLLGGAATIMVVTWLPFGISAFLRTGNPVFPLFNGFFRSPLAPTKIESIVAEMQPFRLSVGQFIASLDILLKSQPMTLLGVIVVLVTLAQKRGRLAFRSNQRLAASRWLAMTGALVFLTCEIGMGPLGQVENRHFLLPLAVFVALGIAAVYEFGRFYASEKLVVSLLALTALGTSSLDVAARTAVATLSRHNLTEAFLQKKPVLALNRALSDTPAWAGHRRVRVLALMQTNTPYFLTNGEFWHASLTYPVWTWNLSTMTATKLTALVRSYAITHLMVDEQSRGRYPALNGLKLRKLAQEKNISLYLVP